MGIGVDAHHAAGVFHLEDFGELRRAVDIVRQDEERIHVPVVVGQVPQLDQSLGRRIAPVGQGQSIHEHGFPEIAMLPELRGHSLAVEGVELPAANSSS